MEGCNAVLDVCPEAGICELGGSAGCVDERGRECVDVDAVDTPLHGEAAREMRDGCFRGAIRSLAGQRDQGCLRGDVHDPAEAPLAHVRKRGLTREERPSEIDVEDVLERREREILDGRAVGTAAGVVYENVERAEAFDRLLSGEFNLVPVGDIHL